MKHQCLTLPWLNPNCREWETENFEYRGAAAQQQCLEEMIVATKQLATLCTKQPEANFTGNVRFLGFFNINSERLRQIPGLLNDTHRFHMNTTLERNV